MKNQNEKNQNENKLLKCENYKLLKDLNDYKFKIKNYKNIIFNFNKKISELKNNSNDNKSNSNSNNSNNSDSDNEIKRLDYKEVPKLGVNNLIHLLVDLGFNIKDINNKSKHHLKQIYSNFFNNKLKRQLYI